MPTPIPYGRGRWRVTLHHRQFSDTDWSRTLIMEMHDARGRSLEQTLNTAARFTFTLSGRSEAAKAVREMETDVVVWRWDEQRGEDVAYGRFLVAQGEDQLTTEAHTTTFTCHDYAAVLDRRYLTSTASYAVANGDDQDNIVGDLVARVTSAARTSGGVPLTPGSYVPLAVVRRAGDGSDRPALSTRTRDRTYAAQSAVGQLIHDLAAVIDGYDYDVVPGWRFDGDPTRDLLRVFYPNQGANRANNVLEYGGNVATVTRSANSADYANYVRVLGNNGSSEPDAAQLYAEAVNADANDVTRVPVGLWENADNASDVSIQSTLDDKAAGDLNYAGVLIPSYSLGLRSGAYYEGFANMGDTLPVVIRSGRLNIGPDTLVRVVGLSFGISDDGTEDVSLTVGRPLTTLVNLLKAGRADVDALARR